MGKCVDVEITSAGKHYLKCRLLGMTGVHRPAVPLPQPKGQVSGAVPVEQVRSDWEKYLALTFIHRI